MKTEDVAARSVSATGTSEWAGRKPPGLELYPVMRATLTETCRLLTSLHAGWAVAVALPQTWFRYASPVIKSSIKSECDRLLKNTAYLLSKERPTTNVSG